MKKSNNPLMNAAREIKWSFTLASVVYLVLGLVLLLAPNTSRKLLCTVVSAGVTIYGVLNILSYVLDKGSSAYTLELLIGILALAFGIFSLINPGFLLNILIIALGLVIVVGSISGIKRAVSLKSFGFDRWWLALVSACVTLLFALTIIFYPALYGNALMMFIGLFLIVEAVSDLLSIRKLSRFAKSVKVTYTVDE